MSFSEMWALERGLDISIPAVTKLAFLQKKWFIFQNNARIYD
ncbi:hypothetical protein [Mycoplasmopsis cynos]|nr:hypothetical protein [Mycoplasmopsis cynos]UWV77817.1 hypothetical protein NW070_02920 [Mycoplasmopsis cynos]